MGKLCIFDYSCHVCSFLGGRSSNGSIIILDDIKWIYCRTGNYNCSFPTQSTRICQLRNFTRSQQSSNITKDQIHSFICCFLSTHCTPSFRTIELLELKQQL